MPTRTTGPTPGAFATRHGGANKTDDGADGKSHTFRSQFREDATADFVEAEGSSENSSPMPLRIKGEGSTFDKNWKEEATEQLPKIILKLHRLVF